LGNVAWWDAQKAYFKNTYTVICIELAGHGESGKQRVEWSSTRYVDDILSVLLDVGLDHVIVVGHSMSGAYALEAALYATSIRAVVLVDTLKNLDQLMDSDQAEKLLFSHYRKDFRDAVENLLPKFLFTDTTPLAIKERLQREFLQYDPKLAVQMIETLYKMDIRAIATNVHVPIRSINCDYSPTNRENNEKYFLDYDFVEIERSGHYPMLERPDIFNVFLQEILDELAVLPKE
jgi:pimeloyl-ACP methyl ester carboxylesterase